MSLLGNTNLSRQTSSKNPLELVLTIMTQLKTIQERVDEIHQHVCGQERTQNEKCKQRTTKSNRRDD